MFFSKFWTKNRKKRKARSYKSRRKSTQKLFFSFFFSTQQKDVYEGSLNNCKTKSCEPFVEKSDKNERETTLDCPCRWASASQKNSFKTLKLTKFGCVLCVVFVVFCPIFVKVVCFWHFFFSF